VAGFDEVPFLRFLGRPVLCVSQPESRLGEEAARMLIGRIRGERTAAEQAVLKQEILRFGLAGAE
jgi:DNA-binding LacI/PurR family transcriptional regulator